MKKWILMIGLIAMPIGVAMSEETYTGSKEDLHLFVLIGQSNMAGRAPIPDEVNRVLDGAWLWNGKAFEPAKPGLNRYAPHAKKMRQGVNPGVGFIEAYRKANPKVHVAVISYARGGTSIEEWAKGRKKPWALYDDALAAAKEARKQATLKGVLWHQGESNSSKAEVYPEKLKTLIGHLRADLESPRLPVVFGQIGQWRENYSAFNKMIVEQPKAILNTACATTEGLTGLDSAHFDTRSQLELGKRYAAAMITLLNR